MVCWGEAEDAALDELAVPDELDALLVSDEAPVLDASDPPAVPPDALEESDGVVLGVEVAFEVPVKAEEPAPAEAAAVDGSAPTPICA
jgi:hypothetical protein